MSLPGRIGGYEVIGLIGEGGMGVVYRARDPRFDRVVAVKVLHPQLRREPGVTERFRTEAVIQAKLQHPHIVNVLDFVEEGELLAIVQEYVAGQPLDTLLRARGAQGPAWAVHVVGQVAGALGHAHASGLVHRDVKPSNILVSDLDFHAKVTDFGIAKVLGTEKLRTATGARMGTLAYMSPEQIRSPKHLDQRTDVYALGAVLYEVLTGQPPFDADTEYELMERILKEPPPRPPILAGEAAGLALVIETAMAKDPTRRYPSCLEMRQALVASGAPGGHDLAPPPAPIARPVTMASPVPAPLGRPGASERGGAESPAAGRRPAAASPRSAGIGTRAIMAGAGIVLTAILLGAIAFGAHQRRREQEQQVVQRQLDLERENERLSARAEREAEEARRAAASAARVQREQEEEKLRLQREREDLHQRRFTAQDDGSVVDTGTGLVWAPADSARPMTWSAARSYCEAFTQGGRSGWRLPTRSELEGLLIEDAAGGLKGPASIALSGKEYWTADQLRCGGIDASGRDLSQTCAEVVELSPLRSSFTRSFAPLGEAKLALPVLDPRSAPPRPAQGPGDEALRRLAEADARHAREVAEAERAASRRTQEVASQIVGRWWREYSQPVSGGGRTLEGVIREAWRFDGSQLSIEVVKMEVGGVSILDRWKKSGLAQAADGPLAANGSRYTVTGNTVALTSPRGGFFSFNVEFRDGTLVLTQASGVSMVLRREEGAVQ